MYIPIEAIVFLGIFLGILGRTYYPYLQKSDENKNNNDFKFLARYIVTALVSAAITAILIYNTFDVPTGSPFQIFIAAFIFAWGTNDVMNRLAK